MFLEDLLIVNYIILTSKICIYGLQVQCVILNRRDVLDNQDIVINKKVHQNSDNRSNKMKAPLDGDEG